MVSYLFIFFYQSLALLDYSIKLISIKRKTIFSFSNTTLFQIVALLWKATSISSEKGPVYSTYRIDCSGRYRRNKRASGQSLIQYYQVIYIYEMKSGSFLNDREFHVSVVTTTNHCYSFLFKNQHLSFSMCLKVSVILRYTLLYLLQSGRHWHVTSRKASLISFFIYAFCKYHLTSLWIQESVGHIPCSVNCIYFTGILFKTL